MMMMNWNKDGIEKYSRKKSTDEAREAGTERERGGLGLFVSLSFVVYS